MRELLPELATLTVVILWASTFVVTKGMYAEVSPLAFVFIRFAGILGLAFLALAFRASRDGRHVWRVRRSDVPQFVLTGVAGYTLYQLGFSLGLEHTSPFASSLFISLVPLFTLILLAIMRERTPVAGWIGLAVAIVGVVIFLADKRDPSGASGTLYGDALSMGAGLAFAVYGVAGRRLVRTYSTETYTAYTLLAGVIPLLVISASAALAQDWTALSLPTWGGMAFMIVLPVYVAYMMWNWAIRRRGVDYTTRYQLLVPVLSGILSVLFFAEPFGPAKLVGAVLVLLGLLIPRILTRANRAPASASVAASAASSPPGPPPPPV